MLKSKLIATTVPMVLLGLALAATPVRDTQLKASDHKKIGGKIAKYYDAKDAKKGINDAWEDLHKTVEKLEKKVKKVDFLSLTEDWEASLFEATMTTYKEKPKKGKVFEEEITDHFGNELTIALHFPSSYSVKGPAMPLVILVPEAGKGPKEHIDEKWIESTGRDTAILVAVGMPADQTSWDKLELNKPSGVGSLMSAFGYVKKLYAVDMNRIFLAGSGEGIAAALATAAASPHSFAGVIGRGAVPEWPKVANFSIVPTLFVSGGTHATAFADASKEAGFENSTLASGGTEADIWAWVAEHSRTAYPLDFKFSPHTPYTKICSWVSAEGFDVDQNPTLTTKVDRDSNTITIDAENIATVRIFLNDSIVNLDEVVKVVINGTTHEQILDRQRRTLIDLCYDWGDWGRVFSTSRSFDVK